MNEKNNTSKRETIYLDDRSFCQYREMIYGKEWKQIREQNNEASKREIGQANYCGLICSLCNKDLDVGQTVYMVMNNYKLFPNTVIHKDCVRDLIDATKILQSKYINYKKIFR